MNPVTGSGCTSVDNGANANLELIDKFCHLGDMLSVDGDADAAVETRIRIGWNKFWQLLPLLTNNLGTTAKQVAMVWACSAKRRPLLGEEMYGA